MIHPVKTLRFMGDSLDDLKNFPTEARRDAGFELDAVQRGEMPSDFKPMLAVGSGVYEIRVHVRANGVCFMSPNEAMRCMCYTLSKRRPKKPAKPIWIWRDDVTN